MQAKKLLFIFFGVAILSIPVFLIFNSEDILTNGHLQKLQLRGFDPFDPFRGKYLRLNYDNSIPTNDDLQVGDAVYVTFEKDSLGFSYFANASSQQPSHDDYMKTTVSDDQPFFWENSAEKAVSVELDNLTKYFINESRARRAEEIVLDYTANRPNDIYVAIRVLDGETRIEDIYIEETPLTEFLDRQ